MPAPLCPVLLAAVLALGLPPLAAQEPPPARPAPGSIPIGGLVVEGEDERPVAGARVALFGARGLLEEAEGWLAGTSREPAARATTDAAGRFELRAPGTGMWRVAVEAAGRMPAELRIEPLLDALELPPARLVPDAGLEVRVRDAAGRPAAARLAAFALEPGRSGHPAAFGFDPTSLGWQIPVRRAATGPDGVARLPRARGERLQMVAAAHGLMPLGLDAGAGGRLEVVLPAGVARTVRAVNEAGRPVAGAVVLDDSGLLALGRTDESGHWTAMVRSPAAAAVTAAPEGTGEGTSSAARSGAGAPPASSAVADAGPAAAGETTLHWYGRDGRRGSLLLAAGAGPATVRLSVPVAVSGRVVDGASRRPLAGALVWFQGFPDSVARTGAHGRYTVRPSGPCQAPLAAAAPGYLPPQSFGGGACAAAGPTIALAPAAGIEGLVVDAGGRPLAGARLTANPDEGIGMFSRRTLAALAAPAAAFSSVAGRFRLPALSPGQPYRLAVQLAGFAPAELEVAALAPAELRSGLRLVLSPGRRGVGRVVDAAGRPVAGARLRLLRTRQDRPWERPQDWRAVTGADGRFEMAGLLPGRYDLRAGAAGFAMSEVPGIEVAAPGPAAGPAGGDGPAALGTVVLRPGVAIEGLVVDRQDRPVAGAEIEVSGRRRLLPPPLQGETAVVTGADGRFLLGDLTAGESLSIRIGKPGFAARELDNTVAPTSLRVVLAPAGRLAGQVLDADRRAVEGATVFAAAAAGHVHGLEQSDAAGRFAIDGLAAGPVELRVLADGFVPYVLAGVELPEGGEQSGLEVVLERGATVEGRVLRPDGELAAGALLTAGDGVGARPADGEGAFRLAGLRPGPLVVKAEHPDYPPVSRDLDVRPGTNPLTVVFEAGGEVAGRVLDPDGLPLGGAEIHLFPSAPTAGTRDFPVATSGADGTFALRGLRPGSYQANAAREGYVEDRTTANEVEVAAGRRSEVEIRLVPAAVRLRGRLLGLPPAELGRVRVHAMGPGLRVGRVDPQGQYTVDGLAAGEWRVRAEAGGQFSGRETEGRIAIPEGASDAELDLDFAGGLTLSGVVSADGRPVSGAVFLFPHDGVAGLRNAQLQVDGGFRLTGLAPGRYRLQVRERPGFGEVHSEEVELDADRTLRIEVVTARVSGRVLDAADGSPLVGAEVQVEPAEASEEETPRFPASVESDAQGAFHLRVREGRYRLVARRDGYAPAETTVEAEGTVAGLELRLHATEGLAFEVRLASGATPAHVELAVLDAAGRAVAVEHVATTQGGRVRASTVPTGTWELLVQSGDSATLRLGVTVPGTPGRVVLPPGGQLGVFVPALGGDGGDQGDEGKEADHEAAGAGATLRLTDAATGQTVSLLEWGRLTASWELVKGSRVVTGLAPGSYTATVTAADGRTWSGGATVVPGEVPAQLVLP